MRDLNAHEYSLFDQSVIDCVNISTCSFMINMNMKNKLDSPCEPDYPTLLVRPLKRVDLEKI